MRNPNDAARSFSGTTVDGVVVLRGDMEVATRVQMESVFDPLRNLVAHHDVTLDLTDVAFCDSSGLNQLARLYRAVGPGRQVVLRNPSPHVRQLMDVTGISRVMRVEP